MNNYNQYSILSSGGVFELYINEKLHHVFVAQNELPPVDFSDKNWYYLETFEFKINIITDINLFKTSSGKEGTITKHVKLNELGNLSVSKNF